MDISTSSAHHTQGVDSDEPLSPSVHVAIPVLQSPPNVDLLIDNETRIGKADKVDNELLQHITDDDDPKHDSYKIVDENYTPHFTTNRVGVYKFSNGAKVVTLFKDGQLYCAAHEVAIKLKVSLGNHTLIRCSLKDASLIRMMGRGHLKENFEFKVLPLKELLNNVTAATAEHSMTSPTSPLKVMKAVSHKSPLSPTSNRAPLTDVSKASSSNQVSLSSVAKIAPVATITQSSSTLSCSKSTVTSRNVTTTSLNVQTTHVPVVNCSVVPSTTTSKPLVTGYEVSLETVSATTATIEFPKQIDIVVDSIVRHCVESSTTLITIDETSRENATSASGGKEDGSLLDVGDASDSLTAASLPTASTAPVASPDIVIVSEHIVPPKSPKTLKQCKSFVYYSLDFL